MSAIQNRLTNDLLNFVNQPANNAGKLGQVLADHSITGQEYQELRQEYTQETGASNQEFDEAARLVLGEAVSRLAESSSHHPVTITFNRLDNETLIVDNDHNIGNGVNSVVSANQDSVQANESAIHHLGTILNEVDNYNFHEALTELDTFRRSPGVNDEILNQGETKIIEKIRSKVNALINSPEALTNDQLSNLRSVLLQEPPIINIAQRGALRDLLVENNTGLRMSPVDDTGHTDISFNGSELGRMRIDSIPNPDAPTMPSAAGFTLPTVPIPGTAIGFNLSVAPGEGERNIFSGMGFRANINDDRITNGADIMRTTMDQPSFAATATIGGVLP